MVELDEGIGDPEALVATPPVSESDDELIGAVSDDDSNDISDDTGAVPVGKSLIVELAQVVGSLEGASLLIGISLVDEIVSFPIGVGLAEIMDSTVLDSEVGVISGMEEIVSLPMLDGLLETVDERVSLPINVGIDEGFDSAELDSGTDEMVSLPILVGALDGRDSVMLVSTTGVSELERRVPLVSTLNGVSEGVEEIVSFPILVGLAETVLSTVGTELDDSMLLSVCDAVTVTVSVGKTNGRSVAGVSVRVVVDVVSSVHGGGKGSSLTELVELGAVAPVPRSEEVLLSQTDDSLGDGEPKSSVTVTILISLAVMTTVEVVSLLLDELDGRTASAVLLLSEGDEP